MFQWQNEKQGLIVALGWSGPWITNVAKRWSSIDLDLLRRLRKEYLGVRPYIFGDYYPLTPYSLV